MKTNLSQQRNLTRYSGKKINKELCDLNETLADTKDQG